MSDTKTATVTIGELSQRFTTVIEDVLFDANLSRQQINEALKDKKFFIEVEEVFRKKFAA